MAHYSEAFRKKKVAEYRRSGITQREFAAREGINLGTLRVWIYRRTRTTATRELAGPADHSPRLVRVAPMASEDDTVGEGAGLVEAATRGVHFRFGVGTSPSYLASLFAALAR